MSYKNVTKCRACDGSNLPCVFDLGVQPLANNHVAIGEKRQGFYPLSILMCDSCGLAQLSAVVDPHILYDSYTYVSSISDTMMRHYQRLFQDIESEGVEKRLLEIGSNDGGLLAFAKKRGWEVFGVDPAKNLAEIANKRECPTLPAFFGMGCVNDIVNKSQPPDVILARHCFAHMDDWRGFFTATAAICHQEAIVCIEFPYAKDMLERAELDQCYHEHLSFISLKPIAAMLKNTPFHIHRVIRYGIHGGALLLMLRHNDSLVKPHLSADEYLGEESITKNQWHGFKMASQSKMEALSQAVMLRYDQGKIVSFFGASAKATVLINACGFTSKHIRFVTDNSPFKPGKLIPGTDIPIIEESQMLSEHPDFCVLSAWNYRDECLTKLSKWRERGGKVIIPGRELEIV